MWGFLYLYPTDLWVKEHEQLIGTMITTATFQTLEGNKVNTVEENVEGNIKYHEYENVFLMMQVVLQSCIIHNKKVLGHYMKLQLGTIISVMLKELHYILIKES